MAPSFNDNWRDATSFSPSLPQHKSDKDSSSTYATLSDGNITIGGKKTTVEQLGIHTDINTANNKVDTLPNLQEILNNQKTVADATSTIVAASRTYAQNQVKQVTAEKESIKKDLEALLSPEERERFKDRPAEEKEQYYSSSADYVAAVEKERITTEKWGIGGNSSRALNAVTTAITVALGGQIDLQAATNALSPYAAQFIGEKWGHGEDKNTAAQLVAHAILGATLAYVNGGNPAAGGSAAVAAEATTEYLSQQHNDGKTAINPKTGQFDPNLLPEDVNASIRDLTSAIGAVVGGTVGDSAFNVQIAGVVGQNAVENNAVSSVAEALAVGKTPMQQAEEQTRAIRMQGCAAAGLSANPEACSVELRKQGYEVLAGTAAILLPTSVYELVPIGKGVGLVLKGTKKLYGLYKDAKSAEKAAEKSKAKIENNIHRDDDMLNKPYGRGDERAAQFSQNWLKADLKTYIDKFAGKNPKMQKTDTGKIIYTNRKNGIQVIYDLKGGYFRILNPSIKGKRNYLDLDGKVPNNKVLPNGKKAGRTQSEYNEATHFKLINVTY